MRQRYLVRRATGEVWIWTEPLAANFPDLEEVYAETAEEAKVKKSMPDPRTISLEHLEGMQKADLMLFAKVKLGMTLSAEMDKPAMADAIKEAIFTRSAEGSLAPAADAGAKATILAPSAVQAEAIARKRMAEIESDVAKAEAEAITRIKEAKAAAEKAEADSIARIQAAEAAAEEAVLNAAKPTGGDAPAGGDPAGGPIGEVKKVDTGGANEGAGPDQSRGA